MKKTDTKRIVLYSIMLAAGIILSIVESFINVIPVPGAKIGLANIIGLVFLYKYDTKDAFIVNILRVFMVALLLGNWGTTFPMSMLGSIFATTIMAIMHKFNFFGIIAVSVVGSIFHAIGQIIAAIFFVAAGGVEIVYYLPIMMLVSIPAGILTGILAARVIKILNYSEKEE